MLRIVVCIFTGIALTGILGVFQGPVAEKKESDNKSESKVLDMLKSRQFLSVYIMAILSFFLGIFAVGSFKVYGEDNGISEGLLTTVGSVGAIFNAARFIWSGLLDRYSYKWVYGSLLLLEIVFGAVIVLARKSPVMYTVSYCVIMFCEGGHFTLVPNVLKQIFGSKATQLYGFGFSYTGVCAVL